MLDTIIIVGSLSSSIDFEQAVKLSKFGIESIKSIEYLVNIFSIVSTIIFLYRTVIAINNHDWNKSYLSGFACFLSAMAPEIANQLKISV